MDVNLLRSIVTVASLVLFVALMVMVWMPRRRAGFDEAAALPFTGEAHDACADAWNAPRGVRAGVPEAARQVSKA